MFGRKIALILAAGASITALCAAPAGADADDDFITLNPVVTNQPGGLQATGTFTCTGGIGYLDVSAQMDTTGSGTIQLVSSPPGITLHCTGRTETWTAKLVPANGQQVLVPYTTGTGHAQLNRKYWQADSGQVALHT